MRDVTRPGDSAHFVDATKPENKGLVCQPFVLLAVAGQGAGAVRHTGAGVLQDAVARRAHDAAVKIDEHGR